MSSPVNVDLQKKIRLVLLGGGHSNTQVIKHIRTTNVSDNVELILVSDYNTSLYSGMCPGGVANQYKEPQFSVDLVACCQALKWTFMCAKIVEINGDKNCIIADDGRIITYDILSIDIGSCNLGYFSYDGVSDYSISTRPLKLLMTKIDAKEKELLKTRFLDNINANDVTINIIAVGGGCGGCELIMGITNRLDKSIRNYINKHKLNIKYNISSTLITNSDEILFNDPPALQTEILRVLQLKNINIIRNNKVIKMDFNQVYLKSDKNNTSSTMDYDMLLWSTGAASHKLKTYNMSRDVNGWFKVNKYLQSTSHSNIFGAGDCINIIDYGDDKFPPKSGVYAVRQGPILINNLNKYLQYLNDKNNIDFMEYVPQTDFLRLLNTGDGKAVGCKHGISFNGAWVWKLKDWIDVSWMNKFDLNDINKDNTKHFKPKIDSNNNDNDQKQNDMELTVKNAVQSLSINDEPNQYISFAFQWKVLLKMNDDKVFCDKVVKLYKSSCNL